MKTIPCTNYEQMFGRIKRIQPLPIESAPKDGTVIDIWCEHGRISNVYWNDKYDSWVDSNGYCYNEKDNITHLDTNTTS